jgi:uncharacterized protein YndB with AHSA1/START domain
MFKEITIKRTFDAPRELVFRAWTDPALVAKWWGPTDFTTPIAEIDGRQNGRFYIAMHGPKGTEYDVDMPMRGVYTVYDPPNKLVFTNEGIFDEHGDAQLSTICTVTFTEAGGKTELVVHVSLEKVNPAAEAAWSGAEMGWNQMVDKLVDFLAANKAEAAGKSAVARR